MADLTWLGLLWDEGPTDTVEISKYGPYRQSERGNIYVQAAEKLLAEGKAYRCFCTPEELEEMKAQQKMAEQQRRQQEMKILKQQRFQVIISEGNGFRKRGNSPTR